MDRVRVLRIIEYIGPRLWVEETIKRAVKGTKIVGAGSITAVTLTEYPEILKHPLNEADIKDN